ncbi:MAG: DEAD/DEAH box helicase [Acidimicrobiales bacterium]|nr:DEAD/DEAH box helicase [Acidimicrobiales bacterium]
MDEIPALDTMRPRAVPRVECSRAPLRSMQETPPNMSPTFADLGVPAALCQRLDDLGIVEPFPVQAATLPDALAGRDVCGKAPTGSGKTIAFGLPLLARVGKARPKRPRALVLVPTRELASQVEEQLTQLSIGSGTTVLAVYGGAGMQKQMQALGRGVEVIVATPGRLKDLLERGSLRLDEVEIVVVDEADRMADMGFLPEVRRLLDMVRSDRQTLLFSATLDGDVDILVRNYQKNPAKHEAQSMEEQGEVTHRFWSVSHADRIQVAASIVERSWPAIVFSRTRHGAERLSKQLNKAGIRSEAIHGDRSQSQRERALAQFGRGQVTVLVATDVAARGIHVDGVACVLQFDPPATDKDYVHRAGRTGRAGAAGTVITLVAPEKEKDVRKMQRELRRREPIEVATVATAADVLAATPPKPMARDDDLDGVSRRERARAERPDRPTGPRPSRQPHRKGGAETRAKGDGRGRPSEAGAGGAGARGGQARTDGQARNGQGRAGAPARSGRPGAKPGRRPAGAGSARPGRPAGGNARRAR